MFAVCKITDTLTNDTTHSIAFFPPSNRTPPPTHTHTFFPLLAFLSHWDRKTPLPFSCFLGIAQGGGLRDHPPFPSHLTPSPYTHLTHRPNLQPGREWVSVCVLGERLHTDTELPQNNTHMFAHGHRLQTVSCNITMIESAPTLWSNNSRSRTRQDLRADSSQTTLFWRFLSTRINLTWTRLSCFWTYCVTMFQAERYVWVLLKFEQRFYIPVLLSQTPLQFSFWERKKKVLFFQVHSCVNATWQQSFSL